MKNCFIHVFSLSFIYFTLLMLICLGGGFQYEDARHHTSFHQYIQQQYNKINSTSSKHQSLAIYSIEYTRSFASDQGTTEIVLNECIAAYKWLVEDIGISARNIVIGGEGSGGNLTLSTMLQLADKKLPTPAAGCIISGWVDLSNEYLPDEIEEESRDYMSVEYLDDCALSYLGNRVVQDISTASPLRGTYDEKYMAPLFINYGGREILRGQSEALVEKGRDNRIHVTEVVDWRMYHHYILFPDLIGKAASLSCDELVAFLTGVYNDEITNDTPSVTKVMDSW
jgi:acetyl esterase/lipase